MSACRAARSSARSAAASRRSLSARAEGCSAVSEAVARRAVGAARLRGPAPRQGAVGRRGLAGHLGGGAVGVRRAPSRAVWVETRAARGVPARRPRAARSPASSARLIRARRSTAAAISRASAARSTARPASSVVVRTFSAANSTATMASAGISARHQPLSPPSTTRRPSRAFRWRQCGAMGCLGRLETRHRILHRRAAASRLTPRMCALDDRSTGCPRNLNGAREHHRADRAREPQRAHPPQASGAARRARASTCSRTSAARSSTSGKATSIRKRVAGHFSKPSTRGALEMTQTVADFDFLVTETEAEALLTEQNFIKRHRPRYNVRLRDDKSYPYIADLDGGGLPAGVLHAREAPPRAGVLRPLLQRQARARDAGAAGQGVPVPHLPGQGAGAPVGQPVPGLLHQALPGALRGLRLQGGVPPEHRDDHRLPLRALPADREGARAGHARGRRPTRSSRRRRSCATSSRPCARCWSASA